MTTTISKPTLPEQIVELLRESPGLSDREITNSLRSLSDPQQPINIAARNLASREIIVRKKRNDGIIGNYPSGKPIPKKATSSGASIAGENQLSEDKAKEILKAWLESDGWSTEIAWGRTRGIDVEAKRGAKRWIIEVKGIGSLSAMRVNYFIGMLGETLQRMDDKEAKYSIAMPDIQQFRNLWNRLPGLAKRRTTISALFVSGDGSIDEVSD